MHLCKSILDKLESICDSTNLDRSPLFGLSSFEADSILQPIIFAFESGYAKVVEPALIASSNCSPSTSSRSRLIGLIPTPILISIPIPILFTRLLIWCKFRGLREEQIKLSVLWVLLSRIRSSTMLIGVVIV